MLGRCFAVNESLLTNSTSFTHRYRTEIEPHDAIILHSRRFGGLAFTSTADVISARPFKQAGVQWGQVVDITGPTPLSSPRKLGEYAGSLKMVYRYLNPERHFWRHIVKLPEDDYRAIVSGEPDVPRTVFRYILEALPVRWRAEAILRCVPDEVVENHGVIDDYTPLAKRLIRFVQEELAGALCLVADTGSRFSQIGGGDGLPSLRSLTLSDGNGEHPVGFGSASAAAQDLMSRCLLFGRVSQRGDFTDELAREVLASDGMERQWQEPIF